MGEFLFVVLLSGRAVVCSQLVDAFGDLKRLVRWSLSHQGGKVGEVVVVGVEEEVESWRFGMVFGVGN